MHKYALEAEDVPAIGYLRGNYILFQADGTEYFLLASVQHLSHIPPVHFARYFKKMTLSLLG